MKVLVLGGRGQLGSALRRHFDGSAIVVSLDASDGDITNEDLLASRIGEARPDLICNCAGFLNADRCEREPDPSYRVNAVGPSNIVAAARRCGQDPTIVHFSTDFIFDGRDGGYTEAARPHPLSVYGLDKSLADHALLHSGYPSIYVLRIASLVGDPGRPGFLPAVLRRLASEGRVSVVDDLRISLATVEWVGQAVDRVVLGQAPRGLYHAVGDGETSWFDLARHAAGVLGLPGHIAPMSADSYAYAAPRPKNSTLNTAKLRACMAVPPWQDLLDEHIAAWRDAYGALVPR